MAVFKVMHYPLSTIVLVSEAPLFYPSVLQASRARILEAPYLVRKANPTITWFLNRTAGGLF